jgi:hypothetical protein
MRCNSQDTTTSLFSHGCIIYRDSKYSRIKVKSNLILNSSTHLPLHALGRGQPIHSYRDTKYKIRDTIRGTAHFSHSKLASPPNYNGFPAKINNKIPKNQKNLPPRRRGSMPKNPAEGLHGRDILHKISQPPNLRTGHHLMASGRSEGLADKPRLEHNPRREHTPAGISAPSAFSAVKTNSVKISVNPRLTTKNKPNLQQGQK